VTGVSDTAVRERHTHLACLAEILAAETDDRTGRIQADRRARPLDDTQSRVRRVLLRARPAASA
jgi:hypothetical protein